MSSPWLQILLHSLVLCVILYLVHLVHVPDLKNVTKFLTFAELNEIKGPSQFCPMYSFFLDLIKKIVSVAFKK